MRHYGIEEWVDFARGLTPAAERAELESHLSTCRQCREMAAFCSTLARLCRTMGQHAAPDAVLRDALLICPAPGSKAPKRALRLPMELIYDSFLTPLPAGFRSAWQRGWQALYRAGDCSVDLRVEPEVHSARAAVIGQISYRALPNHSIEGLPVYVRQGRLVVAETRSNRFGEFQMEYEQRGRLQLCVDVENRSRRLEIPLRKLLAQSVTVERMDYPVPNEGNGPHAK